MIKYFYSRLLASDRNTIDVVAGGALADKKPLEACDLISMVTRNFQSLGSRSIDLDHSATKDQLCSQLLDLPSLVSSLAKGANHQIMQCGW